MSTSPIITRGFLFTAALVVTAGYLSGSAPPPPPVICIPFRSNVVPSIQRRSNLSGTLHARSAVIGTVVSRGTIVPAECADE